MVDASAAGDGARGRETALARSIVALAGNELGADEERNRAVLAEILLALAFLALAFYVFATVASAAFISGSDAILRGASAATYIANYYMCHQLPERSFFFMGTPIGLCERCLAIFAGALAAIPLSGARNRLPRFMQSFWFVALALVPIGIDGLTQYFGLRESNSVERVATGFLSAFAVMYYLSCALLDRFPSGRPMLRRGVLVPALALFAAAVLLPFAAASAYASGHYESAGQAIARAQEESPGKAFYGAEYVPPHAPASIRADGFVRDYRDPILEDLFLHPGMARHGLGIWVGLALDSPPESEGDRFAYFSNGTGDYYYFDAWNGSLILKTSH
jgi:uncharacterized membrane protein